MLQFIKQLYEDAIKAILKLAHEKASSFFSLQNFLVTKLVLTQLIEKFPE